MENKLSKNHYILSLSWQWIKNQVRNLKKWNWVSLFALFVATMSYLNTSEQYKNSNEQFKDNKKSSDSLFKVQLSHSRALNDSIVSQLKSLQSITNSQLKITKDQLFISRETLQEKLISERPRILVYEPTMDTNKNIDEKLFTPIITLEITNDGDRAAYNFDLQLYIVYNDFSFIRGGDIVPPSFTFAPKYTYKQTFLPKLDLKQKDDFFFCYKINYYDSLMGKGENLTQYSHYNLSLRKSGNEKTIFYDCTEAEKIKLKNCLNKSLKELNKPPFEE